MKIYHIEKGKSEYYIAIREGKGSKESIFGNFYYLLNCNSQGSLIEITLICCDGRIVFDFWSDDFFEFPEHYYELLGQFVFFDVSEISERIQEDESLLPLSELPKFSKKVANHFPWELREILRTLCKFFV